MDKGAITSPRTIHVGNLSAGVTTEVLRQIFGCIGKIVDVRVATDGRYGFVDFAENEAATASLAMNGTEVCGGAIRVQRATQPRLFSNQANPPPTPMLSPEFSAVTSAAALEALQKRAPTAPELPNLAFLNPAQQRAAIESRHRDMLAKSNDISGWGVAKRREDSESSEDSYYERKRRRYRHHYRDRRGRRDTYRRRRRDDYSSDDDSRSRSPPRRSEPQTSN